ncbi:hypothetical protein AB0M39_35180 [Streptomyces sp. NPDC051907]|uniref:hypothetical protein n=1 Tax=Streptomyces sp. NPDC051907 TaxID=3155284 RepID=UPI0034311951
MSTPTPGRTWVDSAPPIEPYRYGLFSVASFQDGVGPWQARGVEYFTDACAQGGYVIGSCPAPVGDDGDTTHDKPLAQGPYLAEGSDPFTVYARSECNAVGFEDPVGDARRRLGLIEEREAEEFFSAHVLGAEDPVLPNDDDALTLKRAVGVLEQHAARNYGGAPTLHTPRWTNPYFNDRRLLEDPDVTGAPLLTRLGSRVVFGGSYLDDPFTPDTPAAADTFWLVATGSVRGWRSDAFVNETFTPETNLRMALAERTYALDADCYRAAVLVTVGGED